MKRFSINGPSRFPWLQTASRLAVASAVIGAFSAAWMTAGPGNGVQPSRQLVHITLPTVVIVGHREAPQNQIAASIAQSVRTVSTQTSPVQ